MESTDDRVAIEWFNSITIMLNSLKLRTTEESIERVNMYLYSSLTLL